MNYRDDYGQQPKQSARRLSDSVFDLEDIKAMCDDAEMHGLDEYAQQFVDDIRGKMLTWGLSMFFSEKQETFLMTIASRGAKRGR